MGLFRKHDPKIAAQFAEIIEQGTNQSESEFLDSLNVITKIVETDDSYSTNQKLAIYELLSQISNCQPEQRQKYARRLMRKLK